MNKYSNLLAFTCGIAIGSVCTWYCVKNKYERFAQEEIDSVKEVFSKKTTNDDEVQQKAAIAKDKPSLMEYASTVQKYNDYAKEYNKTDIPTTKSEEMEEADMELRPYVISPSEFGENEDYERISLSYYADKVLADDYDDLVDDIPNTIGVDSLNTFGKYEDDCVFVRNDRLQCDYEILLDKRRYEDIMDAKYYAK